MDPAHTTFVHGRTIGMPSASEVPVKVEEGENYVIRDGIVVVPNGAVVPDGTVI